MVDYKQLTIGVEEYITIQFNGALIKYLYHNLDHTKKVVQHATFLAEYYDLDDKQKFIIVVSAWFHDTGHLIGVLDGHEEVSVLMMRDYCNTQNISANIVEQIAACIIATKAMNPPKSLSEKILCDADTWHLGTEEFKQTDLQVRLELELRLKKTFSNWISDTIKFLEQHQFFTDYCKQNLNTDKQKNIDWLRHQME